MIAVFPRQLAELGLQLRIGRLLGTLEVLDRQLQRGVPAVKASECLIVMYLACFESRNSVSLAVGMASSSMSYSVRGACLLRIADVDLALLQRLTCRRYVRIAPGPLDSTAVRLSLRLRRKAWFRSSFQPIDATHSLNFSAGE